MASICFVVEDVADSMVNVKLMVCRCRIRTVLGSNQLADIFGKETSVERNSDLFNNIANHIRCRM